MTIIGFNFTSISVEKKAPVKGKVNISNNISLKEVKDTQLALGTSNQPGLRFEFEYTSKYEPDIGSIVLKGEIIDIEEEKVVKDVVKEWKKSKSLSKEIRKNVLSHILTKCNIEAVVLSRELNLPSPIPMPKIQDNAK